MTSFREILYPTITVEKFKALRESEPKRISFGSSHRTALKRNLQGNAAGFLNLPFLETIGLILPWPLFPNKKGQFGGFYRTVSDEAEYAKLEAWIATHADLVFIKSLLTTAVATCEHYISADRRSPIGELEHSAKYLGDESARLKIVEVLMNAYTRLHGARNITGILSVPASTPGQHGLPNLIAAQMAANLRIPDLTSAINWNGPKGSIKAMSVEQKWDALESVGMNVEPEIAHKNILLIDDMYQSGATAHFVASKLRAAGADDIHVLAVSKARGDTDNK